MRREWNPDMRVAHLFDELPTIKRKPKKPAPFKRESASVKLRKWKKHLTAEEYKNATT